MGSTEIKHHRGLRLCTEYVRTGTEDVWEDTTSLGVHEASSQASSRVAIAVKKRKRKKKRKKNTPVSMGKVAAGDEAVWLLGMTVVDSSQQPCGPCRPGTWNLEPGRRIGDGKM